MREKLIELIRKADKEDHESRTQDEHYAYMTDRLMGGGVEIPVRCKDCDNTCPGWNGIVCTIWGAGTEPNNFCSYGERKDNAADKED